MLAVMPLVAYALYQFFGRVRDTWQERLANPEQEGQQLASYAYSCSYFAIGNVFIMHLLLEQVMESLIIMVVFAIDCLFILLFEMAIMIFCLIALFFVLRIRAADCY